MDEPPLVGLHGITGDQTLRYDHEVFRGWAEHDGYAHMSSKQDTSPHREGPALGGTN